MLPTRFTAAVAAAALLAVAATPVRTSARRADPAPRLVVVLTIDQMRHDYVERYGHQWSGGLKRLVDDGARFMSASYPYLNTVTCPGHTTISTGTFPRTHGVILNGWWDRDRSRMRDCYTDGDATALAYHDPSATSGGFGPQDMLAPALADELRAQASTPPRVISVAVKARSAIALAGGRPDTVLWLDRGGLTTSTAFAAARQPQVEEFVRRHPLSRAIEQDWTPVLPASQYVGVDDDDAERPPTGWSRAFPHVIANHGDPALRLALWATSPLVDEYLGRFVEHTVRVEKLGTRHTTDLLAMSFSSLDLVGHAFGPESHEVQDTLVRIDRVLGALLATLDREVGRDRYVVALTADHGVSPIPEQARRTGLSAGRVDAGDVSTVIERVLSSRFGAGQYVSRVTYTDVYLAPGVEARLRADRAAWQELRLALGALPGIERAFNTDDLTNPSATDDPALKAARLSYFAGRSGDLVVIPRPYWILSTAAATHGSLYAYDARVPVILFGAGIQPGRYWQAATPADIAPTLATLAGVTMARAEGRVLSEALSVPRSTTVSQSPR